MDSKAYKRGQSLVNAHVRELERVHIDIGVDPKPELYKAAISYIKGIAKHHLPDALKWGDESVSFVQGELTAWLSLKSKLEEEGSIPFELIKKVGELS